MSSVRVDLACPGGHASRARVSAETPGSLAAKTACPTCETPLELHVERLASTGGLAGCLGCGHSELYTQKDFPRALGIGIVVTAALLVPVVPYYLSLVGAALLDFLLYHLAPDVVVCYACSALHRGFPKQPRHPGFDRTIEERLRYGERAVMGSAMRPEGTAGAPEPEH